MIVAATPFDEALIVICSVVYHVNVVVVGERG